MMTICFGGVCVPLNLLVPFLVGLLHRYGYLKWFRQEWVTFSFWKTQYARWTGKPDPSKNTPQKADELQTSRGSEKDQANGQVQDDQKKVESLVDEAVINPPDSEGNGATHRKRRPKGDGMRGS